MLPRRLGSSLACGISQKRTGSLGPSPAQALCAARPPPLAARLQGPPRRRKLLLITLPRVWANESSQTGAGLKVGLAGTKLSRPEDRTPSRQPHLGFITRFCQTKALPALGAPAAAVLKSRVGSLLITPFGASEAEKSQTKPLF